MSRTSWVVWVTFQVTIYTLIAITALVNDNFFATLISLYVVLLSIWLFFTAEERDYYKSLCVGANIINDDED